MRSFSSKLSTSRSCAAHPSRAAAAVPLAFGRVRAVVGVLAAALAALALSVAPVQATTGHVLGGTFGLAGSNELGGFASGGPVGVAVDPSTGDLLATDSAHVDGNGSAAPRVERFDSTGAFESEILIDATLYGSPSGIAIDSTSGSFYVSVTDAVSGSGAVLRYSLAGTFQSALVPNAGTAFSPGAAIAVDPASGDVYIAASDSTAGTPLVEVFDDTGAFQSSFDGASGNDSALSGIASIAVDGSGNVYITDTGKNRLDRFSAAGAFQATVVDGNARGLSPGALTINSSTGELYVVENLGGQVELFNAGGTDHEDVFGIGGFNVSGIAVSPGSETVYLADLGQAVGLIATSFAGPTVVSTPASSVTSTTATVNGTVNPEGIATDYHFEYGTDANYGSSTAGGSVGSGNSADPVSDQLADLGPNTTYHYRVVGSNANGAVSGADRTFTTPPAPPILDGTPPSATLIQPDGATLNGMINPRGSDTSWHFEYGTTTAYDSGTTPTTLSGPGVQSDQSVNIAVPGLTPGTTYHFRLVADNGTGGTQTGQDATFTTAPVTAAGASSVTGIAANLFGTVNLQGSSVKYHFEYGETTSYGSTTPERDAPSGSGDTTVTDSIAQLKPGTTYHVRVIARDVLTSVTTTGVDGTFSTSPAPGAVTGAVTGVATDQATFSGDVDTHGLGGTYRFYVESPTSPFSARTDVVTVPAGTAAGAVSAALTGLQPGQVYTVRLAVQSSSVLVIGDAVTFATPPQPASPPPPPPITVDNPYGCTSPVINAYNRHPKPSETITVTGKDLGVAGTIVLGSHTIPSDTWDSTSFTFVVPDDAKGSLPLTINCGEASNTVAVQMFQAPLNTFTIKSKVKGSMATLALKVPGPGDISVRGAHVKTVSKHASKSGTYSVKVSLTAKAKKSLTKNKKLTVSITVRFTPNGGTRASQTVPVTFRR